MIIKEVRKPLIKIEREIKDILTTKRANELIVFDFDELINDLKENTTIKGFTSKYLLGILKTYKIKLSSTIKMRIARCLRSDKIKRDCYISYRLTETPEITRHYKRRLLDNEKVIYSIK